MVEPGREEIQAQIDEVQRRMNELRARYPSFFDANGNPIGATSVTPAARCICGAMHTSGAKTWRCPKHGQQVVD